MTTKDTIFQPPFMEIHVRPPFRRRIFDDFLGNTDDFLGNTMVATAAISRDAPHGTNRQDLESAVVRFGGDSGDGMQIIGGQFTETVAFVGNNLATFPDFPAEIRAPTGTTYGVSSYQINFGARPIKTSGDAFDVLIAMNPAALKMEIDGLRPGGILVVDQGAFSERNLRKAGYDANPLHDESLDPFQVTEIDISHLTLDSVNELGLTKKDGLRCKNFWALGYVYWMFGHDRQLTIDWLRDKFASKPGIADANIAALNAGHAFAETSETQEGFHGYSEVFAYIWTLVLQFYE